LMTARCNFLGDVADRHQRRLVLLLRDERSQPLDAREDLFGGQLTQRAIARHARPAKGLLERRLPREHSPFLPRPAANAREDVFLDALEGGGAGGRVV
ncbi:hypothetical protein N4Q54_26700, partial [Leclercia adecarboxylata]